MTALEQAYEFIEANKQSPVVEGRVIGRGGQGAVYRLDDGRTFRLSADVCAMVEPRWKLT